MEYQHMGKIRELVADGFKAPARAVTDIFSSGVAKFRHFYRKTPAR
jgi:hypothetical protein